MAQWKARRRSGHGLRAATATSLHAHSVHMQCVDLCLTVLLQHLRLRHRAVFVCQWHRLYIDLASLAIAMPLRRKNSSASAADIMQALSKFLAMRGSRDVEKMMLAVLRGNQSASTAPNVTPLIRLVQSVVVLAVVVALLSCSSAERQALAWHLCRSPFL